MATTVNPLTLMMGNTRRTAELGVRVTELLVEPSILGLPPMPDDFEVRLDVADPYPDRLALHVRSLTANLHVVAFVTNGVGVRDHNALVWTAADRWNLAARSWDQLADETADCIARHANKATA